MISEHEPGPHITESSQPIDVGTNIVSVDQPEEKAFPCDGHVNQKLQGLPIVGAVTRGEHTDEPSQTLLNAAAVDQGVDIAINGATNSMTHPAPSVASHVNASEIMDPVGVAVGETLGVNPTQTSNKYTANASTRTSFQNTRIQQERDEIIWSNHLKDFLHDKQTKKGQHRRISGPVGGEWAQCQRRYNRLNEQGKSTPLTAERKQSLDDIGFDWHDPPRPPTTPPTMDKKKIRQEKRHAIGWLKRLEDLRDYQTQHGHIRIPRKSCSLGEWVWRQRRFNRLNERGQSTFLTAERKQLLDDIGFDWHPNPRESQNMEKLTRESQTMDKLGITSTSGNISENVEPVGARIGAETQGVSTSIQVRPNENGSYDISDSSIVCPDTPNHAETDPSVMKNSSPGNDTTAQQSASVSVPPLTSTATSTSVSNPFQPQSQKEENEIWMNHYNELCEYRTKTGHLTVYRKSAQRGLGEWCHNQREQYKADMRGESTSLTKERIQLLEELGFIWGNKINGDGSLNPNPNRIPRPEKNHQKQNEVWSNHLQELREYQTQHGLTRVPYMVSGNLGKWIRKLRWYNRLNEEHGKSTPLTAERKKLLDEMGFNWVKESPLEKEERLQAEKQEKQERKQVARNEMWSNRLQELREYQTQHGLTRVPYMVSGALGKWILTQRRHNQRNEEQGKSTPLTAERRKILDEMGFNWGKESPLEKEERKQVAIIEQKNRFEIAWSNKLKDLREFQTEHGHIRVPRKSGPLGEWVRNQRQYNRLNEEGQSTQLTTERKQLLDEMGFIWNPLEHKRKRGGKDTHKRKRAAKRKRLNGAEPVGASGGQVMAIKCEEQQGGGGDTKLEEPLLMSTPAQRKAHEESNDLVQLLPGEENLTEMWNRLNGAEPGGASGGPQAMAIKGEEQEQGGGDAKLGPLLMLTPVQRKAHEECNYLIQFLPGEESRTEKRKINKNDNIV